MRQIVIKLIPLVPLMLMLTTIAIVYAQPDLSVSDSFITHESININVPKAFTDAFHISEGQQIFSSLIKFIGDSFHILEGISATANAITTITTTITSIITVLGQGICPTGSCFFNTANTTNTTLTVIVIPAFFFIITVFGFIFMGAKTFGVIIMVASFMLLGLAFIGIIPSWITLFVIIMVAAALTKIVVGFFKGEG